MATDDPFAMQRGVAPEDCTCTLTSPAVYPPSSNAHPAEWEQDPLCRVHPAPRDDYPTCPACRGTLVDPLSIPGVWMPDCGTCDGRGYLTRDYCGRFIPRRVTA